jgi:hypothetical protein
VQSREERPPLVAVPSEVEATAVPDAPIAPDAFGAASRFARSMMELVVGTPHVGTAERVVSAGTSIVEFVGAPMRRFVEPAIDNRAEAAQEAMVSLLELTRVVVQEAVEIVDLNAVLDRIDLNALLSRIDLNELLKRVDINDMLGRLDVDELMRRVDIGDILNRVDLNELMARVDVTELIGRVDIEAILNRVDINEIVSKVDIDGIVERTEIGSLVVRSTSGIATEALDAVRSGAVGVDGTITRVVDRVLRRKDRKPRPLGPGRLAPDATA